ncbi:MAG: hypothetical protein ACRYGK_02255 [Janthinobacterium lividum]
MTGQGGITGQAGWLACNEPAGLDSKAEPSAVKWLLKENIHSIPRTSWTFVQQQIPLERRLAPVNQPLKTSPPTFHVKLAQAWITTPVRKPALRKNQN